MGPIDYQRQTLKIEALTQAQQRREIRAFTQRIRVFHYTTSAERLAPHGGGLSLKMVVRGAEAFTLGARSLVLRAGEALLMPPDVEYGSEISEETETFSAFFPRSLCRTIAAGGLGDALEPAAISTLSRIAPVPVVADVRLVRMLHAARIDLAAQDWERAEERLQLAVQHMVLTSEELAAAGERLALQGEAHRRELLKRLQRARAYLHYHLAGPVSLDRLAEVCHVSRFHLLRCFRQAFGCTPAQYHAELRLQRAWSLLQKPGARVADVAHAVGYRSHSAFSRAWKRRHGSAPSEAG